MAILGALSIARSGLVATGEALGVTGNNIANVNTTAYKGSRPEFADLLTTSTGGGSGLGVRLGEASTSFVQGSIENTARPTDLAIEGRGFFVVSNGEGDLYTRAGNFALDANGRLVTATGHVVQGYELDANNVALPPRVDIDFGNINGEVGVTGTITLQNNLSADAEILPGGGFPGGTDFEAAFAGSNFTRNARVYDSLGRPHNVTLFFTRTATNTWDVNAAIDAGENGGTPGEMELLAGGPITLTFNTSGALQTVSTDPAIFTAEFEGAEPGQEITLDVGTSLDALGSGTDGVVSRGGPTSLASGADGFGSGELRTISVEENGIVIGHFDNGQSRALYQVALADFAAPDKLASLGNGLYRESVGSGVAAELTPQSGGLGRIIEQSIERSNVDLATEFVNLISLQRAFQANARVITTSDGLLNDLINIVR